MRTYTARTRGELDDASIGYKCCRCGAGPFCFKCWPEDWGGHFCGGACAKFYCMSDKCSYFEYDSSCEMYCRHACALPGTAWGVFPSSASEESAGGGGSDSEDSEY